MSREKRFAFTGREQVELQEFELGEPGEKMVLVRNAATMLSSGTEGIVFRRAFSPGNHWDNWVKYPFYPGYAAVGRVEAVGPGVTAVKVGDRVATRTGHASAVLAHENDCNPIPDGLSFDVALWFAFAKITAIGVRAARYRTGDLVAVVGAGIIGQMSARWAYASGAAKVIVIDPVAERLKYLEQAGDFDTIARPVADSYGRLAEICGGQLPGIVVETTGNPRAFQDSLKAAGQFGRVVLMTDPGSPEEQRLCGEVITRGLTIVGAHDSHDRPDWNLRNITRLFFAMCLDGRIRLEGMVSHRFSREDPALIYRTCIEERDRVMGIVVDWEA